MTTFEQMTKAIVNNNYYQINSLYSKHDFTILENQRLLDLGIEYEIVMIVLRQFVTLETYLNMLPSDINTLSELIKLGILLNKPNDKGYTPLERYTFAGFWKHADLLEKALKEKKEKDEKKAKVTDVNKVTDDKVVELQKKIDNVLSPSVVNDTTTVDEKKESTTQVKGSLTDVTESTTTNNIPSTPHNKTQEGKPVFNEKSKDSNDTKTKYCSEVIEDCGHKQWFPFVNADKTVSHVCYKCNSVKEVKQDDKKANIDQLELSIVFMNTMYSSVKAIFDTRIENIVYELYNKACKDESSKTFIYAIGNNKYLDSVRTSVKSRMNNKINAIFSESTNDDGSMKTMSMKLAELSLDLDNQVNTIMKSFYPTLYKEVK